MTYLIEISSQLLSEEEYQAIGDAIHKKLRGCRITTWVDADGEPLFLADHLTRVDDKTIRSGLDELDYITEDILDAIATPVETNDEE